jgi:hypothetical protein
MAVVKKSRLPRAKPADAIVQTIREEAEALFTHMVDSFIRGYRRRLERGGSGAAPKPKRVTSAKAASPRRSPALLKRKRRSAAISVAKARSRKAK